MAQRYASAELTRIDDAAALRSTVGDKAAEMVELARDSAALGARFPEFSVIGAATLDRTLADHGVRSVPSDLPDLPNATDVPPFAGEVERLVVPVLREALADRTGEATVLRSSLLWPSAKGHRPPGVDNTLFLASSSLPDQPGIVARLYKAYTTLCLRIANLPTDEVRPAGLIVMDLVPGLRWQGTAYLLDNRTTVEIAGYRESHRRSYADLPALRADGLLEPVVMDRLAGLCTDLGAAVGPNPQECVELEFLIDQDGQVWVLQRRVLPAGSGVFHTPGRYAGPMSDLRRVSRADLTAVDAAIDACAGRAAVVAALDDATLDSFALAWRLRATGRPAPAALVLLAGPGSRSGLPIHVPWLLRDALPGTLLVSPPDGDAGLLRDAVAVRLASDGVSATLQWT
jgi:hypothetical protein